MKAPGSGASAYAVGVALALLPHLGRTPSERLDTLWLTAIHFAGFAFLCALRYPLIRTREPARGDGRSSPSTSCSVIVAAVSAILLIVSSQSAIYARGVRLATHEYVLFDHRHRRRGHRAHAPSDRLDHSRS
jgi:TRAP-type uncharacterized transport system fused permease subunit